MEEDIKILVDLIFEIKKLGLDEEKAQAIENLIKRVKELEEENEELKAKHIFTHNEVSTKDKAKLYDVIDNSIDKFLEGKEVNGKM